MDAKAKEARMQGLGFAEQKKLLPISTLGSRHHSPDSLVGAASGDGCNDRSLFRSDDHDHQSLIVQLSKDLAGDRQRAASCSLGRHCMREDGRNNNNSIKKIMAEGEASGEEDEKGERKTGAPLEKCHKECQNESEDPGRVVEKQRPASPDLKLRGYAATTSPRLASMRKPCASPRQTRAICSPRGAENANGMGIQKDGNSEQVPPKANSRMRDGNAGSLPFSKVRGLPSKWEDAEKWICSPVSGDGTNRPQAIPLPPRRPMSKSGPMDGLGIVTCSSPPPASSAAPAMNGGRVGNFTRCSALTAGVCIQNGLSGQVIGGAGAVAGGASCPVFTGREMMRSASVQGWSDRVLQRSLPKCENNGTKVERTVISAAISRRDMGTQMSPVHQCSPSPDGRHSHSPLSLSVLSNGELQGSHFSKLEVKDVQVDSHVAVAKKPKRHSLDKCSTKIREGKKIIVESPTSDPRTTGTEKCISKIRRDEARIMAWENMKKEKAEEDIRKLEVKLEKMRTSSMNKIMNKLRMAQKKAQQMRNSMSTGQEYEVSASARRTDFRKTCQMRSITGCFPATSFSCIYTLISLKQMKK